MSSIKGNTKKCLNILQVSYAIDLKALKAVVVNLLDTYEITLAGSRIPIMSFSPSGP